MKPWVVGWNVLTFLRNRIASARRSVQVALIARMPRSAIEPLSAVLWRVYRLVDARARWEGLCRYEMGRDVLDLPLRNPGRVAAGRFREQIGRAHV